MVRGSKAQSPSIVMWVKCSAMKPYCSCNDSWNFPLLTVYFIGLGYKCRWKIQYGGKLSWGANFHSFHGWYQSWKFPHTKINANTVNEHSQAGGRIKTSWQRGCTRACVMRCLLIVIIIQLMAPSTLLLYYFFTRYERKSEVWSPKPAWLQLQIARLHHVLIVDACTAQCHTLVSSHEI